MELSVKIFTGMIHTTIEQGLYRLQHLVSRGYQEGLGGPGFNVPIIQLTLGIL